MNPAPPEHLGDGAYITTTHDIFVLTANHHDPNQATDTVYLEPEVMVSLLRYIKLHNPQLLSSL